MKATNVSTPLHVAVIGGGIAGLACAYFLQKQGHRATVLEAASRLGGLGTDFEHEGVSIDKFYHVALDSDDDLIALLADLGVSDRLLWKDTGMGFFVGGRLYGFNGPIDLLRFRALSLVDRVRTGLGALFITKLKRNGLDLDNVRAVDWLPRLFGRNVFKKIWDPLLTAKFGDLRHQVPAYWVWNTLNREKDGGQEVKGCLRGGYRGLIDTLSATIRAGAGEIHLDSAVAGVEVTDDGVDILIDGSHRRFDAVVSTLPMPLLKQILARSADVSLPVDELRYQGCVNAVVILRRKLQNFYWTAVVDSGFDFQGVVETTHVIPPEWIGDRHLAYLMNYCSADSEIYARSDETVRKQAIDGLARLYPGFGAQDVEDIRVFRAPHVEPVWTLGYLDKRPQARVSKSRLFLCTTAQAYPRVTAWNTSIALARETVEAIEQAGFSAASAGIDLQSGLQAGARDFAIQHRG